MGVAYIMQFGFSLKQAMAFFSDLGPSIELQTLF